MAYRQAERQQRWLFPESIEEYISPDDPVRAYDAFVETLDLQRLGMEWNPQKVGCPQYDPTVMLKILVYGYSYGIRSSRKLERALYHNLSFIWLAGALKPDHKTISRFRRENRKALKQVLKECARLCIELDLIAGNTLFVDGTKLRANASLNNLWTSQRCQKYLARLDQRIDEILSECDRIDQQEGDQESLVQMKTELNSKQKLKAKVQRALDKLQSEGSERLNTTDPECARMHGRQGSHAGYNAQIVVDEKHGLIPMATLSTTTTTVVSLPIRLRRHRKFQASPAKLHVQIRATIAAMRWRRSTNPASRWLFPLKNRCVNVRQVRLTRADSFTLPERTFMCARQERNCLIEELVCNVVGGNIDSLVSLVVDAVISAFVPKAAKVAR